jgi:hypothetical protein
LLLGHRFLASLTLVVVACAPPALGPAAVTDSQFISEDEVEASRAATAYDVIQKLHANFLSYHGETSFDKSKSQPYPTVYVDDQEFGPIASLRSIPASQVSTIRLYRPSEATTKFGGGNMGGVIAITTRR